VLLAFEKAEELAALGLAQTTSPKIQKLLTFVLVGAGTVGVEMASTLASGYEGSRRGAAAHNDDPRLIIHSRAASFFERR
jgi:NADH dehydrogenase FAD-containing subunit